MTTSIILAQPHRQRRSDDGLVLPCRGCGDTVLLTDLSLFIQAERGLARPMCARCVLNRPGVRNVKGGEK